MSWPEYTRFHWKVDKSPQRPVLLLPLLFPCSRNVCSSPPRSSLPANTIMIRSSQKEERWARVDFLGVLTAKSSAVPFSLLKVQETFLQEPQQTWGSVDVTYTWCLKRWAKCEGLAQDAERKTSRPGMCQSGETYRPTFLGAVDGDNFHGVEARIWIFVVQAVNSVTHISFKVLNQRLAWAQYCYPLEKTHLCFLYTRTQKQSMNNDTIP